MLDLEDLENAVNSLEIQLEYGVGLSPKLYSPWTEAIRDAFEPFDGAIDPYPVRSQFQEWQTKIRMGYDLSMTPLEVLDELERLLK